MATIDKPGIYRDFPVSDYFDDPIVAQPSLSQSIAKIMLDRSPAHAFLAHPRLTPEPLEEETYSSAKAIGNAFHALATGRSRELAIGKWDDWRSKEARAFKTDALATGLLPILQKHLTCAAAMLPAMRKQLDAAGHAQAFAGGSNCEVVLAWEEDGIWLRTMIDCVAGQAVYDLKTSAMSCAPHVVAERPSDLGWDIQAAMFQRGLNRLDPGNAGRHEFYFVAQENDPPYALTVVEIGEADMTLGRKKLDHAIHLWRECMASGAWPAYPAQTVTSHPRGWTETQWLEREESYAHQRTSADHLMAG